MDGDRLTDAETALVLRRAAELEHRAPADAGGLDPATLEEVAVEVGLSRQSVRRALAELRVGALAPRPDGRRAKASALIGPATLALSRSLPGPAHAVHAEVRRFLERQLFRLVRDAGGRSVWVPREDLGASVRRRIDRKVQKRLCLDGIRRVELAVVEDPGEGARSLVHLRLDLGAVRRASAARAFGGGAAAAAAVGGPLLLLGLDPATAAAPAGAAAALAGQRLGTAHQRRRSEAVETALHGMLDALERPRRPTGQRTV